MSMKRAEPMNSLSDDSSMEAFETQSFKTQPIRFHGVLGDEIRKRYAERVVGSVIGNSHLLLEHQVASTKQARYRHSEIPVV